MGFKKTSSSQNVKCLTRKTRDVDGGWAWVALFGTFLAFVIQTGSMLSKGVYMPSYLEFFGQGRSHTAWIGSLYLASFHFGSLLTSAAVPKIGARLVVLIGGVLLSSSYAILSFIDSISIIIVIYGILGGLGGIFVISGCIAILPMYFKKHIFLASGITFAGGGIGVMTVGSLSEFLIDKYGMQGALLVQSGVCLHICLCSALMYDNSCPATSASNCPRPLLSKPGSENAVIDHPAASQKLLQKHDNDGHDNESQNGKQNLSILDKFFDRDGIPFIDDPENFCGCDENALDSPDTTSDVQCANESIGNTEALEKSDNQIIDEKSNLLSEDSNIVNCVKFDVDKYLMNNNCLDSNKEVLNSTVEPSGHAEVTGCSRTKPFPNYTHRLRMMLSNNRFWILTFATQFASMAGFTAILFFKDMLRQNDLGSRLMVLFMGSGGVFGRVSAGIIAKHVNRFIYFAVMMVILCCDLLMLLVANKVWMVLCIGFLVTTCQGKSSVLHTLMAIDVYGRGGMHLAWTWSMAFAGFGTLAAAPLAGLLADVTSNFTATIIMFASWAIFAAFFALILFFLQRNPPTAFKNQKN